LDVAYAKEMIEALENNKLTIKSFKNPYGEKGLSKKIVDILVK
jgi:UDP-N-acetylglucosamine 2-epimerase